MLVLVLVSVLATVAVAGAAVGGLLVGQRRAASAADLAALAAAEAIGPGGVTAVTGASACQEAGRVSNANRARLTGCLVEGDEVFVEVEVNVPGLGGAVWEVPGRARAGPSPGAGPTAASGPGP